MMSIGKTISLEGLREDANGELKGKGKTALFIWATKLNWHFQAFC